MRKNERIELRISAEEKATLQQRSLNKGLSLSEYIKRRALGTARADLPTEEDRRRAEQTTHSEGFSDTRHSSPAPLDAEPGDLNQRPAEGLGVNPQRPTPPLIAPVAPKLVEKPRDPQPESDYRRIRRAGLKQRKP